MKDHLDKLDVLVQSINSIGESYFIHIMEYRKLSRTDHTVSIADLCEEEELAEVIEENFGRKTLFGSWNTREKLWGLDERNEPWTNEDPSLYAREFELDGPKMTVE